ncbi:unnamed protein product [Pleuronectes platessa]|uniref:Uncharacterized protein n=1 Tax=Pleuronectes platessa TaxID=8262 RepID=A0A9N7V9C3_PLEPL|nr:unnamed protein product [Pleuronectes platessa]
MAATSFRITEGDGSLCEADPLSFLLELGVGDRKKDLEEGCEITLIVVLIKGFENGTMIDHLVTSITLTTTPTTLLDFLTIPTIIQKKYDVSEAACTGSNDYFCPALKSFLLASQHY